MRQGVYTLPAASKTRKSMCLDDFYHPGTSKNKKSRCQDGLNQPGTSKNTNSRCLGGSYHPGTLKHKKSTRRGEYSTSSRPKMSNRLDEVITPPRRIERGQIDATRWIIHLVASKKVQ